jgi:glucuronate isomerase
MSAAPRPFSLCVHCLQTDTIAVREVVDELGVEEICARTDTPVETSTAWMTRWVGGRWCEDERVGWK